MHKRLLTTALLALLCGFGCHKEHTASSLENINWQLKKIVDGNVTETVPDAVVITALFQAGQLMGKGACNDYFSTYTTTGDQISIAAIVATKRACPNLNWEVSYFEALQTSQSWMVSGNTLTVQTADVSLIFEGL